MLNYLVWALTLTDIPPVLRLLIMHMADRGKATTDAYSPDHACATISMQAAMEWIGCGREDITGQIDALRQLEFESVSINGDILAFTFPDIDNGGECDAVPRQDPTHSIYVIVNGEVCKVGISRFPEYRMSNLQAANPLQKLTLYFVAKGPKSKIIRAEKLVHAELARYAIGREWFRVEPETAARTVRGVVRSLGVA